MTVPALRTDHLTKRFGWGSDARLALDGLDLSVEPGQVYGFLGKNGAGKTTTVRILLDLMRPTGGHAYLFGIDPRRDRSALRRVGALVEGASFYPYLTGRGNLELLRQMTGKSDEKSSATLPAIDSLLAHVNLSERADDRFGTYSTGMKQRLGIAAALLDDPELVILDEPINGMDPIGVVEIRQLLRGLVEKDGKTVFLSSHLLNEVEHICDRIAILDRGRIVCEGAVADLLAGRGETVRIEVGSVSAALTALSVPSALGDSWLVQECKEPNCIEVHVSRTQIPEVVARLTAQQVEIFEIVRTCGSLEELFLSVVK